MMKFSVLMSVYKNDDADFLKIALESIYDKQTRKPDEVAPLFMQEELTEKPLFWEIFTNGDDDAMAYQLVRSLDESTVAKMKGKVVDGMRDAVGDNMLRKIHALVK